MDGIDTLKTISDCFVDLTETALSPSAFVASIQSGGHARCLCNIEQMSEFATKSKEHRSLELYNLTCSYLQQNQNVDELSEDEISKDSDQEKSINLDSLSLDDKNNKSCQTEYPQELNDDEQEHLFHLSGRTECMRDFRENLYIPEHVVKVCSKQHCQDLQSKLMISNEDLIFDDILHPTDHKYIRALTSLQNLISGYSDILRSPVDMTKLALMLSNLNHSSHSSSEKTS